MCRCIYPQIYPIHTTYTIILMTLSLDVNHQNQIKKRTLFTQIQQLNLGFDKKKKSMSHHTCSSPVPRLTLMWKHKEKVYQQSCAITLKETATIFSLCLSLNTLPGYPYRHLNTPGLLKQRCDQSTPVMYHIFT